VKDVIAVLLAVGAYFFGSIPAGLVVSHLFHGIDVREQGSGNIGTANVYRVAGRRAAIVTLLFDAFKGLIPVLAARALGLPLWAVLLTGAAAVVGHNWSFLLRGRGGKGIATSIGIFTGLAPVPALLSMAVFIGVLAIKRYASLASLMMIASFPLFLLLLDYHPAYWLFGSALLVVALYRHRANIGRLLSGTELKIKRASYTRGQ
jgi:glycerol-3-phosphate acyltransferase PlsY